MPYLLGYPALIDIAQQRNPMAKTKVKKPTKKAPAKAAKRSAAKPAKKARRAS